jgi:hypothetical protein
MNDSQEYGCFKTVHGEFVELATGTSKLIKTGGATNTMAFVAVGNEFVLYINKETAAKFTDSSITAGSWGMYAGTTTGGFKAHYDVITVYYPK